MRANPRPVRQGDEHVVIRGDSRAPDVELRVHVRHWSEQRQSLIDQMAPEVEQQSTGFAWVAELAPAALCVGPPPVEMRLEAMNFAECVLGEETAEGQKIAVPSAILIHGKKNAPAPRRLDELPPVG